jgi:D-sedoheptulose 7-phosphate isomerase
MAEAGEVFSRNVAELVELLPRLSALQGKVTSLCQMMMSCWQKGGKIMFAGNGGSAAGAMHFTEELLVRFHKNRKALAALSLCDPTVITCAGNDFGYDEIFARQVEGLGKPGDMLVVMSTSGNSENLVRAVRIAQRVGITTVAMAGKDGGKLKGMCDLEIIVPSSIAHHIQEAHKVIYHAVCEWVDTQVA